MFRNLYYLIICVNLFFSCSKETYIAERKLSLNQAKAFYESSVAKVSGNKMFNQFGFNVNWQDYARLSDRSLKFAITETKNSSNSSKLDGTFSLLISEDSVGQIKGVIHYYLNELFEGKGGYISYDLSGKLITPPKIRNISSKQSSLQVTNKTEEVVYAIKKSCPSGLYFNLTTNFCTPSATIDTYNITPFYWEVLYGGGLGLQYFLAPIPESEFVDPGGETGGGGILIESVPFTAYPDYRWNGDADFDPYQIAQPGDGGGSFGGGGGGGAESDGVSNPESGSMSPYTVITFDTRNEIQDILEYLKCLSSSSPIQITLFVDQPKANTRNTWAGNILNPDVGHTYIQLEQNGIVRTLGFYPSEGVSPTDTKAKSLLNNDSGHVFDVSITTTISDPTRINNLLNFIKNYKQTYDLNNYNCTDFGIDAFRMSGVTIPKTTGSWGLGSGKNPGDLGQDLRGIKGGNISVNTTGGTTKQNKGGC